MELQFRAQFPACETTISEFGEDAKIDSRQQDFGIPKAEGGLQDSRGIKIGVHFRAIWLMIVKGRRLDLLNGFMRVPFGD